MLTKIEALKYRALHYTNQTLDRFQVLIGPNASGKSTFLDVVAFMADIINKPSLTDAVRERVPDLRDLTWLRNSDWLELAIEADIPPNLSSRYTRLRYEIRLGIEQESSEISLLGENLWFITQASELSDDYGLMKQRQLFPTSPTPPPTIVRESKTHKPTGWRKIVSKTNTGNDYFQSETTDWKNNFRLSPRRPALANLPEDEVRFPVSTWFKRYLSEGVQRIMLNSEELRKPSPPQSPRTFLSDGSNLPWVIYGLEKDYPELLQDWIEHIRTALPDIRSIVTVERPEDRHRYLIVEYDSGLKAPAWLVSDGTLRMLALTILAYLPKLTGVYLIEEPENGIHPRAVETVFQSLSRMYEAQVFLATHSPVILSLTDRSQLLCFARTETGETDIVRGDLHPSLIDWDGKVNLSILFAGGVLG